MAECKAYVESIAEILMKLDSPLPKVWAGEPHVGKEVDDRGGVWTTYTPVCTEKEREKWRGKALSFLRQLRAARLTVTIEDSEAQE